MIRLVPDQSAQIRRAGEVGFTFDGVRVTAHAGESVTAALIRSGRYHLCDAPEDGAARGAFCLMGLCQECVVLLDGVRVEGCRLTVRDGMVITSLKWVGHE